MPHPLPATSLDIVRATKVVTFNAAAELSLGPATLVAHQGAELAPVETKFDVGNQRATLIFAEELSAGSQATLRIGFEAALTDSMTGYYKSTWERGTYALTQFEVREWPVHICTWVSNIEVPSEPKKFDFGLMSRTLVISVW
jgi:aminopeptidase 2